MADVQVVDVWSKDRAKLRANANSRINDRMLNSAFASFNDWDPLGRRLGVWVFNSRSNCYTFLPFYLGWGSPYGSSYNTSLYYPPAYYPYPTNSNGNQPQPGQTYPSSGSGSGGGHSYPSGGGGGTRPTPPSTPQVTPPSGGGFGGGMGGGRERLPDQETGRPMPRKNIEPSRPNQ